MALYLTHHGWGRNKNFHSRLPKTALTIRTGKNCFTQFSARMAAWLTCLHVIHQTDSKNDWLLLSASFMAKFELIFVLTLENEFS